MSCIGIIAESEPGTKSGEPRDRHRVSGVGGEGIVDPTMDRSIDGSQRDRIGTRSFLLVFLIGWSSGASTARFPRPSVVWVQAY